MVYVDWIEVKMELCKEFAAVFCCRSPCPIRAVEWAVRIPPGWPPVLPSVWESGVLGSRNTAQETARRFCLFWAVGWAVWGTAHVTAQTDCGWDDFIMHYKTFGIRLYLLLIYAITHNGFMIWFDIFIQSSNTRKRSILPEGIYCLLACMWNVCGLYS